MNQLLRFNLFLTVFLLSGSLWSQEQVTTASISNFAQGLQKLSISASMATHPHALQDLHQFKLKDLTRVSLGEISVSYQLNSRFSLGLGNIANLGNCLTGYFDAEGKFFTLSDDEDDDPNEPDDDLVETEDGDDDDGDCEDEEWLDNLMGVLTVNPFANFPLFLQLAGGYSFGHNAPAYSSMLGYRQNLLAGLGITAGFRYSDVLYKLPANAVKLSPSNGLRLELGLNWSW